MPEHRILIVDDEVKMRRILEIILKNKNYGIDLARDGEHAWELINKNQYHLIVTDLKMPQLNGMDLLNKINRRFSNLPVIIITAYGSVESAVSGMKKGAFDYITKPFEKDEIRLVVSKALHFHDLKKENHHLKEAVGRQYDFNHFIGDAPNIKAVRKLARKVASTNSTVLIQGNSGTGKELMAKIIHYNSPRASKPLISFNCGALPDQLVESELFGYEKGAFTGATKTKPGKFELADTGTIFLDEIGDMKPDLQVKLLRVLQEKRLDRLGATKTIPVDVRIIAATNRDLQTMVEKDQFRTDLYYRINVFPIIIPPIKDHQEDLPVLISHFLKKLSLQIGKPIHKVSDKAMEMLLQHLWPGNVREIQNCLERAMILCEGKKIEPLDLILSPPGKNISISPYDFKIPDNGICLESVEKSLIITALQKTDNNQVHAAKLLTISRNTLRYRMEKYAIETAD